jgi:FAD:protein FMN transferase
VTIRSASANPLVHVEQVMGTTVSFHLFSGCAGPSTTLEQALAMARSELRDADEVFSTWRVDSPLSRLRRGVLPPRTAPPVIRQVLDLCAHVRDLSGGWFDPWRMPGGVDPTGLVKGWAVERALGALRLAGADAASVNAGGDVAVFGRPEGSSRWRIGVRHPWRPEALACVLLVEDAVATSGTYERGPHLRDPRTGERRTRAASASVVGPSLAVADGLSTALAVGGDDMLARLATIPGYEGYLVRTDGTEAWTDNMPFAG